MRAHVLRKHRDFAPFPEQFYESLTRAAWTGCDFKVRSVGAWNTRVDPCLLCHPRAYSKNPRTQTLMNLILVIIILLLLFGGGGGYYYGGPMVGGGIGGLLLIVLIVYLLVGRRA